MLDEKTKELIAIGASIAANCEYCLNHHVGEALRLGVCPGDMDTAAETGRLVHRGAQRRMDQFAATLLKSQTAATADCGCGG